MALGKASKTRQIWVVPWVSGSKLLKLIGIVGKCARGIGGIYFVVKFIGAGTLRLTKVCEIRTSKRDKGQGLVWPQCFYIGPF